jgi:hypothetical protein
MVGAQLHWRQGRWTLQQGASRRTVTLTRRSTATQWLVYLAFNDMPAGSAGQLWLYADSIPRDQLRKLRVRLVLLE